LPLPEAVPSRQSKSMLIPDTWLAETGEGGGVLGSAPVTVVVRCVIVPVLGGGGSSRPFIIAYYITSRCNCHAKKRK